VLAEKVVQRRHLFDNGYPRSRGTRNATRNASSRAPAAVIQSCAKRATITSTLDPVVNQAKRQLAASRKTALLARRRITGSRARLSQSGDTVVAAASHIGAARSALQYSYR